MEDLTVTIEKGMSEGDEIVNYCFIITNVRNSRSMLKNIRIALLGTLFLLSKSSPIRLSRGTRPTCTLSW